jgi:peptide/nickel transport system substrate-binding protein
MKSVKPKRLVSRRHFLQLGAATAAGGLVQVYGPAAQPAVTPVVPVKGDAPKRGGTFTLALSAGIQRFAPYVLTPGNFAIQRALFNTPVRYDSQLNPQPELAEKWDFSADGRTMTLKLRRGVKFHSGREFTAEDVRFCVQFASTDESSTIRQLYSAITSVEVPDKYTAVLKFQNVNPSIFDLLDMLYIIDREAVKDLAKTAVGTGPFRLERYLPNDRVEFAAFKDYWEKGKPYLDRCVVRQIPDLASLTINLESGEVDCIWMPNYIDHLRLQQAGGRFVTDIGAPSEAVFNLAINCQAEPFTNKKVRQAMAWSIDRARFCKAVLRGLVEPTCLMWPPHSWAFFKDLEGKIGFDLDRARDLLKEVGLEKGFQTEILTSSKRSFGMGDIAQILQADLKKIGVNAKVTDLESGLWDARWNKGDFLMTIHTYGRASRDPGSLLTGAKIWYTAKNGGPTRFDSPEWDGLASDVQSGLDREKRKGLCRKIQEMALDECFTNPIAPQQRTWAYWDYVKGFGYNLDNSAYFADIWLDR